MRRRRYFNSGELQAILCCPHTKTTLSLITISELLKRLPEDERRRVPEGTVGAFVSESSLIAYPIVGRIVDFLEQDSLLLSKGRRSENVGVDFETDSIQLSVKQWYDNFGWQRNEAGIYNDTALFSQMSPTAHALYELASHVSLLDRLSGGDFILDAASGAIAQPDKLAYSWFYRHHVCVDISRTALQEANRKLGDKGFCCMANICQLPFREGVFDGIVSGYTVQHIAEAQQSKAIAELYRVLKPGGHLCIISELQETWAHRNMMLSLRAIRKMLRLLPIGRRHANTQLSRPDLAQTPPHKLYFQSRDLTWWRKQARELTDSHVLEGFRLFKKEEFELLFGESTRAAKAARALETLFPRLTAKMCAYLLVDLVKQIPKQNSAAPHSQGAVARQS